MNLENLIKMKWFANETEKYFFQRHMSQVHGVWLMLGRHEEQQTPINELHSSERVDTHEHEDTIEDRHGDELEDGRKFDGETSEDEDTGPSDSLLSHSHEHWSFSRSSGLTVHLETVHVTKTQNRGSHAPGETQ